MYEDLTLQGYLDTILSKEQQHILAYCLKNDVKVCLYGTGLGKSLTARLFHDAGYTNVFAPEGCTDVRNGALSVSNETGAVALCVKKEPSDIKPIEKPFTAKEMKQWIDNKSNTEFYLSIDDLPKFSHHV